MCELGGDRGVLYGRVSKHGKSGLGIVRSKNLLDSVTDSVRSTGDKVTSIKMYLVEKKEVNIVSIYALMRPKTTVLRRRQ